MFVQTEINISYDSIIHEFMIYDSMTDIFYLNIELNLKIDGNIFQCHIFLKNEIIFSTAD